MFTKKRKLYNYTQIETKNVALCLRKLVRT